MKFLFEQAILEKNTQENSEVGKHFRSKDTQYSGTQHIDIQHNETLSL